MSVRDYPRLSIEEFGKHLLDTNELDPIYVGLRGANMPHEQKERWAIAYWCFYHAGTASYMSQFEGEEFWSWMFIAAHNITETPIGTRWMRGSERRHFRGQTSVKSITDMQKRYGKHPEDMVRQFVCTGVSYEEVAKLVKTHYGFGDWISFKVADMLERIFDCPIDFSQAEVFMFKDPVESAMMLWRQRQRMNKNARPKDPAAVIHEIVSYLEEYFDKYEAPPSLNRPIGLQEVETILCKWKSHMRGHYPLYNDIDDIRKGLEPWLESCEAARRFELAFPARGAPKWTVKE